jgi:gliding motility-associated-like protein
VCENGKYRYTFKIKNDAPFDVQSFVITPLDPNIQVTPALVNLPPPGILSNTTSGYFSVNLSGTGMIPGQPFCFYLTAHDQPVFNGNFPQACCTDSVLVDCLPIPDCDPCDGVLISAKDAAPPVPTGACCQSLSLTNNYLPGYFTGVQIVGLGGVQLSFVSGWAILPPVLPSSVTFIPPGGTLNVGTFNDFAEICLNGFTASTQQFVVNLLGPNGEVVCADTLGTECEPPPPPTCAAAVKDSIWCDGGQVKYTFSLLNAPTNTFDIYSFNLLLADPTGVLVTQDYFVLGTPLQPGQTAGPFTIDLWGSSVQAGNPFCFVITAHNGVWGGDPAEYPTTCCTDSVAVRCLPIPGCGGQDSCCTPSGIQMPTGLSPNGDNLNDVFKILGTEKCRELSFTVYNRWGNIVYHQDNYNNAWNGTNQDGADLPQGTYFILLTLHDSGSTVSGYVDLRRL